MGFYISIGPMQGGFTFVLAPKYFEITWDLSLYLHPNQP